MNTTLLSTLRDAAKGRSNYLHETAERFSKGPEDYKRLLLRSEIMSDISDMFARAIRIIDTTPPSKFIDTIPPSK